MKRCDSGERLEKIDIGLRLTPIDQRKYLVSALSQGEPSFYVTAAEIDDLVTVVHGFDSLDRNFCPTLSQSAYMGGVPVQIYASAMTDQCTVFFPGVSVTYSRSVFVQAIRQLETEDSRFKGRFPLPP